MGVELHCTGIIIVHFISGRCIKQYWINSFIFVFFIYFTNPCSINSYAWKKKMLASVFAMQFSNQWAESLTVSLLFQKKALSETYNEYNENRTVLQGCCRKFDVFQFSKSNFICLANVITFIQNFIYRIFQISNRLTSKEYLELRQTFRNSLFHQNSCI